MEYGKQTLDKRRSLAPSDLPPPILGSASRGFGFPLTRGNSKGLRMRIKMKIR
jgi:hypothetical protein